MTLENNITSNILHDRKIAILSADGFDESQLFTSKKALEEAGADVLIVSPNKGKIRAWEKDHWSTSINVDIALKDCDSKDFDALVIPGGEMSPDELLQDKNVSDFVKEFVSDGKSIATICHGTRVLIDTGMIKRKSLTTHPCFKKDVINSGATWKDDEIVVNNGIISSRCPAESPKFIKKMIEVFSMSPRKMKARTV